VVHDPAAATDRPSRIKAPWAHQQFPRSHYLLACLRGYWAYRLRIRGVCRQGAPRFRPPCRGPRPYTISAVNSFGGNFVWVLWLAYQSRSMVAATLLADSMPSDHASTNAPTTARSVYVIAHSTARPPRLAPRFWGGGAVGDICR